MDLIETFVQRTDLGLSPERYRRWAILAAIGAATDRKVWTSIRKGLALYPNLYVLLVGKPGCGKTQAVRWARLLLGTQPDVGLCPNSVTHERFIEMLGERASKVDVVGGVPRRKATISLFASEWGTFLRRPEPDTLAMLADVWDCGDYEAQTIGRGTDFAENLFVTILSGCTPAWFAEGFPPNSYEQGLPTRMLFIYSDYIASRDLPDFDFDNEPTEDEDRLLNDLFPTINAIGNVSGFWAWSPEAGAALNAWKDAGFAPEPSDPMLEGYSSRRHLQVAKIALIYALARHPKEPGIQLRDFELAREVLMEAEPEMMKALFAAGGNVYQGRMEAVAAFVAERYRARNGKPVPEMEVRQFLGKLVDPHLMRTVLEELIASQRIRAIGNLKAPERKLMPGVRR